MNDLRDEQLFLDEDTEKCSEEDQIAEQPDQDNTSTETKETDLPSVILSDEIQSISQSDNNDRNGYTESALLSAATSSNDFESSQTIEFSSIIIDYTNVSHAVEPFDSVIETPSEKLSIKSTTSKRKSKHSDFFIEIVEEEKSIKCSWDAPKDSTELNFNNQKIKVTVEDLDIVESVGEGHFGSVESVTIKKYPDTFMAVKRISLSTKEEWASVTTTELKMMEEVGNGDCPYLINYYGSMIDTIYSELCIFMEYMDTTLSRFYETMHLLGNINPNNLDFLLRRVIHNIASALQFLAERHYLHRDIKPDNILVNNDGVFKLNDYGTCCEMNEMGLAQSSPIGTIAYFSPELVRDPPAPSTIQGDMWALGISLIETIIGEHPCAVSNYTERLSTLSTWNREILEGMIPDDIREFILQLLAIEAEQRPDSYAVF
ncbi:unnamed protein product [Rotaria sordida]|uniref:mitogen-activated protein kinase kinase n=1 Tax=Rotaria sordida TaxID=392033 RepID=A0A814UJD1_9BILA|nr:unnamed protein product [Rotaria sordida]CAF1434739.1 unnamed protein product [Rotaria sordida]